MSILRRALLQLQATGRRCLSQRVETSTSSMLQARSCCCGQYHHSALTMAAHPPRLQQCAAPRHLLPIRCSSSAARCRVVSMATRARGSSRVVPAAAAAALAQAPPAAAAGKDGEHIASLSEEQQRAVTAPEQHVRVIAGPGSGKTRVVAARISWLLEQQQCSPESILAITFTRKAAAELKDRVSAATGPMEHGPTIGTFHAMCGGLLRRYNHLSTRPHWLVASDDDCKAFIEDLLEDYKSRKQAQQADKEGASTAASDASPGGSSLSSTAVQEQGGSTDAETDEAEEEDMQKMVDHYRRQISKMKNFVESTHSESRLKKGADILQELQLNGEPGFGLLDERSAARLAAVFDGYQRKLQRNKVLDFDDMLHVCLVLVREQQKVRSYLHRTWRHILVDETQDTNLVQFELLRQITGPNSNLFTVGDPDQAIYGFRGAKSHLMQKDFQKMYPAGASYFLSDNYRSLPPITVVADLIRTVGRPPDYKLVAGRSKRQHAGQSVQLKGFATQDEEHSHICEQLQKWHKQGYAWDNMAVLARRKREAKLAYHRAIQANIPAHVQTGDFWDAPEIKAALALLRAVVYPQSASVGLQHRVIAGTDVKFPVTKGLGPVPLQALEVALTDLESSGSSATVSGSSGSSGDGSSGSSGDGSSGSSGGSSGSGSSTTVSGHLLSDCALGSLNPEQATEVWRQWEQAVQAAEPGTESRLAALRGLAPEWQQLPGLKKLNKPQQAGLDRLRGLIRLAAAAATLEQPVHAILQLLVKESGMVPMLQEASKSKVYKKRSAAERRLKHISLLLEMAERQLWLSDGFAGMSVMDLGADEELPNSSGSSSSSGGSNASGSNGGSSSGDNSSSGSSGSSSSTLSTTECLQQFLDYCGLQGDGDEGLAPQKPRVQFMTMHASKGKEFGCVVATAFYEGILPSDRSTGSHGREQERNTAYVAVTRAKDNLLITWANSCLTPKGEILRLKRSTFLDPILPLAKAGKLDGVSL